MNLRTEIAEKPFSTMVIHETDIDKILFGNMQIKTFYHKYGEDVDDRMNDFLANNPIYVITVQMNSGLDGLNQTTRILYRTVSKKPKEIKETKNAPF